MSKVLSTLKHEIVEAIPPAIFFFFAFHLIAITRVLEYGSAAAANAHMAEEIIWPHFWAIQLWMFVLFLLFCTLRELSRAIGSARMRAIFFGPLPDREELQ